MDVIKKDFETEVALKNLLLKVGLVEEMSELDLKIESLIRERYSMSMETCLHRKKLMGTITDEEWNEYTAFVEECIEKASEEPINS